MRDANYVITSYSIHYTKLYDLIKNRVLLPTGTLNSINVFANKNGRNVKNIIRKFEVVPATTHLASLLDVEIDEPIYHIKRLRIIDDSPYQHEETWLSALKFPDLTYQHMQNSKFAYIEDDCGIKIAGCYETITSCMPTMEIATILKLNPKDPLICMETKAVQEHHRFPAFPEEPDQLGSAGKLLRQGILAPLKDP